MKTMNHLPTAILLLGASLFLPGCMKDNDSASKLTGTANFEITDAPMDDDDVKGVFVTVAAIKVDGQAISGFHKQTIDLMAYQNGDSKLLGSTQLEEGSYDDITLVLDNQSDQDGNTPGSYVLGSDNTKHNLQMANKIATEIKINNGSFNVTEAGNFNVVFDFDLRKALQYQTSSQPNDQFDFVSYAELQNAVRLVDENQTGTVHGFLTDNLNLGGDKIIVYAYAKGTYNRQTEMQGQGDSELLFKNAVTSSVVGDRNQYTLAYLNEGDYELHFIRYENKDGRMIPKGELDAQILTNQGLDLLNLHVDAHAFIAISVLLIGVLP